MGDTKAYIRPFREMGEGCKVITLHGEACIPESILVDSDLGFDVFTSSEALLEYKSLLSVAICSIERKRLDLLMSKLDNYSGLFVLRELESDRLVFEGDCEFTTLSQALCGLSQRRGLDTLRLAFKNNPEELEALLERCLFSASLEQNATGCFSLVESIMHQEGFDFYFSFDLFSSEESLSDFGLFMLSLLEKKAKERGGTFPHFSIKAMANQDSQEA